MTPMIHQWTSSHSAIYRSLSLSLCLSCKCDIGCEHERLFYSIVQFVVDTSSTTYCWYQWWMNSFIKKRLHIDHFIQKQHEPREFSAHLSRRSRCVSVSHGLRLYNIIIIKCTFDVRLHEIVHDWMAQFQTEHKNAGGSMSGCPFPCPSVYWVILGRERASEAVTANSNTNKVERSLTCLSFQPLLIRSLSFLCSLSSCSPTDDILFVLIPRHLQWATGAYTPMGCCRSPFAVQ